jgi:predicted metal-dependent HD superfamily phosphohydrolase
MADTARPDYLRERWTECFSALSLRAESGVFESILRKYAEGGRAYHTLRHIEECFEQFDRVSSMSSPGAVGLALWFHDAIYDPRASDNELRSALWAREVLVDAKAANAVIDQIQSMILATRHDAKPADGDTKILLDIDLSILGANRDRYGEYEVQVRKEYEWVDEVIFRQERIKILRRFLDRPSIYTTGDFRDRFEVIARNNLQHSISVLSR